LLKVAGLKPGVPSLLIVVLLIPLLFPTVNAAPIVKEYAADFIYGVSRDKGFSFKVRVAIQTEPNGKWRYGAAYTQDVTISLTYVNESMFNVNNFKVLFHSPRLRVNGLTFGHGTYEILSSSAEVKPNSSGTITIKYVPSAQDGQQIQVEYLIEYTIYNNDQAWSLEPSWVSPEAVNIEIETSTPPPEYPNIILYAAIAIIVLSVSVGTYFVYKSRKSKRETRAPD